MPSLRACIDMVRRITVAEALTVVSLFVLAFVTASLPWMLQ